MYDEENKQDRRKPLTDAELDSIKEQLLESIYADIGKSLVKKILWVVGASILAGYAWLKAHNIA